MKMQQHECKISSSIFKKKTIKLKKTITLYCDVNADACTRTTQAGYKIPDSSEGHMHCDVIILGRNDV